MSGLERLFPPGAPLLPKNLLLPLGLGLALVEGTVRRWRAEGVRPPG